LLKGKLQCFRPDPQRGKILVEQLNNRLVLDPDRGKGIVANIIGPFSHQTPSKTLQTSTVNVSTTPTPITGIPVTFDDIFLA
jgi:hypothetical protein